MLEKLVFGIAAGFAGLVLLGVLRLVLEPLAIAPLATGWYQLPARVLPAVRPDAGAVVLGLATVVALVVMLHSFLRWLHAARAGGAHARWRPRWTLAAVGGLVLAFGSGLAAVGLVESSRRLAEVGFTMYSRESKESMMALRTLGTTVEMFAIDEGHYPVHEETITASELFAAHPELSPKYLREPVLLDGWGRDLLYRSDGSTFRTWSRGLDGRTNDQEDGELNDPRKDIVFSGGSFVAWPR